LDKMFGIVLGSLVVFQPQPVSSRMLTNNNAISKVSNGPQTEAPLPAPIMRNSNDLVLSTANSRTTPTVTPTIRCSNENSRTTPTVTPTVRFSNELQTLSTEDLATKDLSSPKVAMPAGFQSVSLQSSKVQGPPLQPHVSQPAFAQTPLVLNVADLNLIQHLDPDGEEEQIKEHIAIQYGEAVQELQRLKEQVERLRNQSNRLNSGVKDGDGDESDVHDDDHFNEDHVNGDHVTDGHVNINPDVHGNNVPVFTGNNVTVFAANNATLNVIESVGDPEQLIYLDDVSVLKSSDSNVEELGKADDAESDSIISDNNIANVIASYNAQVIASPKCIPLNRQDRQNTLLSPNLLREPGEPLLSPAKEQGHEQREKQSGGFDEAQGEEKFSGFDEAQGEEIRSIRMSGREEKGDEEIESQIADAQLNEEEIDAKLKAAQLRFLQNVIQEWREMKKEKQKQTKPVQDSGGDVDSVERESVSEDSDGSIEVRGSDWQKESVISEPEKQSETPEIQDEEGETFVSRFRKQRTKGCFENNVTERNTHVSPTKKTSRKKKITKKTPTKKTKPSKGTKKKRMPMGRVSGGQKGRSPACQQGTGYATGGRRLGLPLLEFGQGVRRGGLVGDFHVARELAVDFVKTHNRTVELKLKKVEKACDYGKINYGKMPRIPEPTDNTTGNNFKITDTSASPDFKIVDAASWGRASKLGLLPGKLPGAPANMFGKSSGRSEWSQFGGWPYWLGKIEKTAGLLKLTKDERKILVPGRSGGLEGNRMEGVSLGSMLTHFPDNDKRLSNGIGDAGERGDNDKGDDIPGNEKFASRSNPPTNNPPPINSCPGTFASMIGVNVHFERNLEKAQKIAVKFCKKHNITTSKQYLAAARRGELPKELPKSPSIVYQNQGFKEKGGFPYFLGKLEGIPKSMLDSSVTTSQCLLLDKQSTHSTVAQSLSTTLQCQSTSNPYITSAPGSIIVAAIRENMGFLGSERSGLGALNLKFERNFEVARRQAAAFCQSQNPPIVTRRMWFEASKLQLWVCASIGIPYFRSVIVRVLV
jgi:hypothetical protein